MQELSIPKRRIAVLVGVKGKTKKEIEQRTKTELKILKEGDILIDGEALNCFIASNVIKAVGRGFNPVVALQLVNEDYVLEIIRISTYIGRSKKKFVRVKARLIGTKGKARKVLEKLTNTDIVIYGKTVSIIGKYEDLIRAKQAIEYLLDGAPHGNVYKFLERGVKKKKCQ